ncbi:MAG: hypothetical protein HYU29_03860 [Chloroflexi bacterium]|nr:hypothetical protein [Chloroflexota bacterium]
MSRTTKALWRLSRWLRRQRGLTLLELSVVSGILTLMAGLVALAVTGRTTGTRATAQVVDISQIQKAVDAFTGEHPQGRYPSLNGCIGGQVLDLLTRMCVSPGQVVSASQVNYSNLEFPFSESSAGADLNSDGDTDDTFILVPMIWEKAFEGEGAAKTKRFVPNFLARHPKHAYDFLAGADTSWKDGVNSDPDQLGNIVGNPGLITALEGFGAGPNRINLSIAQTPVWAIGNIDGAIRVVNLLPQTRY